MSRLALLACGAALWAASPVGLTGQTAQGGSSPAPAPSPHAAAPAQAATRDRVLQYFGGWYSICPNSKVTAGPATDIVIPGFETFRVSRECNAKNCWVCGCQSRLNWRQPQAQSQKQKPLQCGKPDSGHPREG